MRRLVRFVLLLSASLAGIAAFLRPAQREAFGACALALLLILIVGEMFPLRLDRLIGLRYLHRVIEHAKGNKTKAAEMLGIDRRTVSRILTKVSKQGKTPTMQTANRK